jgi:putative membrane protein
MRFFAKIILHIVANALAIIIANRLIPGFAFFGDSMDLFIASAVLGIVNSFLKPVLKLLTFPLIILTLGLFSVIINIALLFFVSRLVPSIQIDGFWAALGAIIIISLVNNIVSSLSKKTEE